MSTMPVLRPSVPTPVGNRAGIPVTGNTGVANPGAGLMPTPVLPNSGGTIQSPISTLQQNPYVPVTGAGNAQGGWTNTAMGGGNLLNSNLKLLLIIYLKYQMPNLTIY